MKFELHPLCALFPRMKGKDFEALMADIAANGLRQPIVTHNGMILDGGNRYEACLKTGVKPSMMEYKGANLVEYVMSANFHRRHLSSGQQAAIVASATDWARAQTHGGNRKADQAEGLPLDTVKARAAMSGATERTQRDADKLAREKPEVAKQVAQGEKSLYQATKEGKTENAPQQSKSPALEQVEPDPAPVPEYTELDAAHDQISELQSMLAVANMGDVAEEDKTQATGLIAELREENRKLKANLSAVTKSRDLLMNELAMVKKQCVSQQAQLKKLRVPA